MGVRRHGVQSRPIREAYDEAFLLVLYDAGSRERSDHPGNAQAVPLTRFSRRIPVIHRRRTPRGESSLRETIAGPGSHILTRPATMGYYSAAFRSYYAKRHGDVSR